MSRQELATNASLLAAACCFYSSSLNAFVFKSSLKTINFYDLVVLFGLKLHGEEIDPLFIIDTIPFNSIIIKSIDYDLFIKSYCSRKDLNPNI